MIEKEWLSQYSSVSMVQQMKKAIHESYLSRLSESSSSVSETDFQRAMTIRSIGKSIVDNQDFFKDSHSLDFDLFKFSHKIGRQNTLTQLTMYLLRQLPSKPTLVRGFDEIKLVSFLNAIQSGYKSKVQYHNDLHGTDVMQ